MQYRSHVTMALAGATFLQPWHSGWLATAATYGLALLGGVLPDIDHPRSFVGRRVPLLPTILFRTTGHRGATHSALAVVAAWLAGDWLGRMLGIPEGGAALAIGYASHLLGDVATSQGVPLLWPASRQRIAAPLTPLGALAEPAVVVACCAAAGYAIAEPHWGQALRAVFVSG